MSATDQGSGGARLLLSDVTIIWLLLNEARRYGAARLFGVARDQSVLVSVMAVAMVAGALRARAARVAAAPKTPSLGDSALAGAMLNESVHGIAGEWSKETPLFTTLLAIALLGKLARPALRVSFRDVKASAHRARLAFDHRYGHLIARGRRRR